MTRCIFSQVIANLKRFFSSNSDFSQIPENFLAVLCSEESLLWYFRFFLNFLETSSRIFSSSRWVVLSIFDFHSNLKRVFQNSACFLWIESLGVFATRVQSENTYIESSEFISRFLESARYLQLTYISCLFFWGEPY